MKRVLPLIVCVLFAFFAQAQTRILFDATKAEMANNADWIIDADKHNIMGNESNPSRYPTPDQSGISANTKEYYWKGALSAWAVDAVKEGYIVETLPVNGHITYGSSSNLQDLTNYDVFIVCEPNIRFKWSEKTALMKFVKNGGGLFMVSDHNHSDRNGDGWDSPAIWNDWMDDNSVENNPFGFSFDYEFFTEATTNIPNLPNDSLLHGSYGNVTSVEFYGGTSMTLHPAQNSTVKGVVYQSGYSNTGNYGVMCAYAKYGAGRVVALGDSSPADDGSGDTHDNLYDGWLEDANGNHERLIMNATIWLAQKNVVGIEAPLEKEAVSLYPNPVHTKLYVSVGLDVEQMTLFNSLGQVVGRYAKVKYIDVSDLPQGIYYLYLNGQAKAKSFQKL